MRVKFRGKRSIKIVGHSTLKEKSKNDKQQLFNVPEYFGNAACTGKVMLIGGGPDHKHKDIYPKIIELSGGAAALVGIINTSNINPKATGAEYVADFEAFGTSGFGAKESPYAVNIDITNAPEDCNYKEAVYDRAIIEQMEKCTGFYFPGGDQNRVIEAFFNSNGGPTPALEAVFKIWRDGGVIAGTSSGAAMMCNPMLISGVSFTSLYYVKGAETGALHDYNRYDDLALIGGMGVVQDAIVDPHMVKRGRIGRLIVAMLDAGKRFGYGVGEVTGMILDTNGNIEVIGDNGVVIVDMAEAEWDQTKPFIRIENIRLHFLANGDKFESKAGQINPSTEKICASMQLFDDMMKKRIANHLFAPMLREYPYRKRPVGDSYCFDSVSFDMDVMFRFAITNDSKTLAYYGNIEEPESYCIENLKLDIIPMRIYTEEF
ncbi:MAG: cyanophycinase [Negativicutes bacterium]|jgi:cyanophycinase